MGKHSGPESWTELLAGNEARLREDAPGGGLTSALMAVRLIDAAQGEIGRLRGRLEREAEHSARLSQRLTTAETEARWLRQQLGEIHADNHRLRQELDKAASVNVLIYPGDNLDDAALACMDEPDGTIIRSATSGKELVKQGGTWHLKTEGDDHG